MKKTTTLKYKPSKLNNKDIVCCQINKTEAKKSGKLAFGKNGKSVSFASIEALCKTDGNKFYVRMDVMGKLYNPYKGNPHLAGTNMAKFSDINYTEVNQNSFNQYKKFLETKDEKWLRMSENQRI